MAWLLMLAGLMSGVIKLESVKTVSWLAHFVYAAHVYGSFGAADGLSARSGRVYPDFYHYFRSVYCPCHGGDRPGKPGADSPKGGPWP